MALDPGPAGIPQPQQLRYLVVSFARRIIQRPPHQRVAPRPIHGSRKVKMRMPSRNHQRQRLLHFAVILSGALSSAERSTCFSLSSSSTA